jgi:hypothetical protein
MPLEKVAANAAPCRPAIRGLKPPGTCLPIRGKTSLKINAESQKSRQMKASLGHFNALGLVALAFNLFVVHPADAATLATNSLMTTARLLPTATLLPN